MDADEIAALEAMRAPVSVLSQERLLRAMFYGDPGMKKTTLAAMLVEQRGMLVSSDSAWTVLQGYPDLASKVDRYPFEGFSQLRALAKAHDEGIEPFVDYDTIIWDTVSTSVQRILRRLVKAKKFPKEQSDPDVEGWPHFRLAERSLVETIEALNKSRLNIIYLAHTRIPGDQDKAKRQFAIRPNMPDACYKAVSQEVSLIGWLHPNDQGVHEAQVHGSISVTAKSQISTIQGRENVPVLEIPKLVQEWKHGL